MVMLDSERKSATRRRPGSVFMCSMGEPSSLSESVSRPYSAASVAGCRRLGISSSRIASRALCLRSRWAAAKFGSLRAWATPKPPSESSRESVSACCDKAAARSALLCFISLSSSLLWANLQSGSVHEPTIMAGQSFTRAGSGAGTSSSPPWAKLQWPCFLQRPAKKKAHILVLWNFFFAMVAACSATRAAAIATPSDAGPEPSEPASALAAAEPRVGGTM
mmetsp:Transcript_78253/g.242613  ORF Transcript_78253/g.242613 Transcript_78253/m.242613 type:complete len:221 (-) Transcript_78253:470-1132(-)